MTRWQFWLLMAAFAACGVAAIVQARADQPTCLAQARSGDMAKNAVYTSASEPQGIVEQKAIAACTAKGGKDCHVIWTQCAPQTHSEAGGGSLGKQGWKNP